MRLPCASLPWVLRSIDKFLCLAGADVPAHDTEKNSRIIDLDVDIGADAVDYKYVLLAAVALRFFVFVFSDVFFFVASLFQRNCQPRIIIGTRNGDAQAGGNCQGNRRRDGLPQKKGGEISKHEW